MNSLRGSLIVFAFGLLATGCQQHENALVHATNSPALMDADTVKTLQQFEIHVGRYQIYSGSFRDIDGAIRPALIKLDTVTGETWEFNQTRLPSDTLPNLFADGWDRLNDSNAALFNSMLHNTTNSPAK